MLAGENDYAEDFANALVLMAALCLGLPYIISENYRYGMDRLEGTCIRSRRSIRYRLIMTAIYTALCFAAAYIPQIIWLNRDLGFTHIDYPLACIMKLAGISLDVSIAGYFAVVYAIRFFVALVAAYIIALSGFIIKKSEYIMAASFAVFTVPVIIKILGLDVLDMISLNRLLSGNMLFRG